MGSLTVSDGFTIGLGVGVGVGLTYQVGVMLYDHFSHRNLATKAELATTAIGCLVAGAGLAKAWGDHHFVDRGRVGRLHAEGRLHGRGVGSRPQQHRQDQPGRV